MTKVTDTELERLLTGAAFSRLARRSLEQTKVSRPAHIRMTRLYNCCKIEYQQHKSTAKPRTHHTQIESSIGKRRSVVVDVVEHALGNLQHSLVDDVLVGSAQEPPLEHNRVSHLNRDKLTGCQT